MHHTDANGFGGKALAAAARGSVSKAARSDEPGLRNGQDATVLPIDPGFTVEAEVGQKFVKGEDIAFCFRADPGLLGRAMRQAQPHDPADWKLNYDVFVVCDGHSGIAVRSPCPLRSGEAGVRCTVAAGVVV